MQSFGKALVGLYKHAFRMTESDQLEILLSVWCSLLHEPAKNEILFLYSHFIMNSDIEFIYTSGYIFLFYYT